MMIFDPQKRITPAQALKHPYFNGWTNNPAAATGILSKATSNQVKNFENPMNDINKPNSKQMRIESRKGVLSRKSSVNKNSFYNQKSKNVHDYMPKKPTLMGSRGGNSSSYMNKNMNSSGNS
eukprot:CAMPEP_0176376394 /NCGR_PEP_ID=MMETSP0126-20121128/28163_1 /TAXON_ID=141414 ORGANISM="Strombidinopsis acuminatum, Strain SPMC142" /NCGR_SAMPLE_ID=MMETSP0126 /ASSEMBLY_ACC=CAM_ASM_000229 /LENGTH=121 /DNA_ID=CAMNT_0017737825 /DNA_START=666 /DNA_END=1031 /DNA_ORIENTATION=+